MNDHLLLALLFAVSLNFLSAKDGFLWVEGEAATSHTMREHGWYNSVKKGELSGGDWLSHFNEITGEHTPWRGS